MSALRYLSTTRMSLMGPKRLYGSPKSGRRRAEKLINLAT